MPVVSPEGRHKLLAIFAAVVLFAGGATLLRARYVSGRARIFDRVKAVLVRRLSVNPERVRRESRLAELKPDGLDRQELELALEEEFGIDVPDGEADHWQTVQDSVSAVDRLQLAQRGP